MSGFNRTRWAGLWRAASGSDDGSIWSGFNEGLWFDTLEARYAEPHRHYHSARHISECLAAFDMSRHLANGPVAVELALWFHDAIYDTHAADNEEQSAFLAERCLQDAGAEPHLQVSVTNLVLATKSHDASKHEDAPLLVDIDLGILGADEKRFLEYESQIRKEYDWVPEALFSEKRAEILERFLNRDRIYLTPLFFETHEERARANLRASLARLRSRS
jgi:predicted metal-dependent HD superfamily phosphohydrolase